MGELADRLRAARERAGLSARALDDRAEITPGHTTLIESGRRENPAAETVRKLARALGVSIDWLVTGAEAAGSAPSLVDDDDDDDRSAGPPVRRTRGPSRRTKSTAA